MSKHLRLFAFSALAVSLSACTKFEVRKDVEGSIRANQEAQSLVEWELSASHPHQLVSKWLQTGVQPDDVCAALLEQTGGDLTVFEDHLHEGALSHLVNPCKTQLNEKLEGYWSSVQPATSINDLNFKFSEIVTTRDTKNGYYAIAGDLPKGQVLLTFDDGPHPEYTDKILAAMARVNAKAVFFTKGQAVRAYPEVLRRIGRAGHGVGSHSVSHSCLPFSKTCEANNGRRLSYAEATGEIIGGHKMAHAVLGWIDPFFRFPYGESSPELKKFLRENEMAEFYWNVDSNDWRQKSPSQVVSDTMAQVNARGRGILLFHDVHRRTAEAVPELLKQLYYGGYTPVVMLSSDPNARMNNKLVQK